LTAQASRLLGLIAQSYAEHTRTPMSVTEFERHQLYSWFEEHMGQERATTMMNLIPPTGWGDVATRRDLHLVEARIDSLESRVDAKIATLEAKVDSLGARLEAKIDTLEARLDAKIETRLGEFRADLTRTLGTWLFASQAAVIAVVTLLLTLT
jgi:BMFP domain-containing protein YqiC